MLRWTFDGSGEWFAESAIGVSLFWRIGVCDDGTFAVSESSSELTRRRETFDSLADAKAFCNHEESLGEHEASNA